MPVSSSNKRNHQDFLVGLLAYQGAYEAHGRVIESLGIPTRWVRDPKDFADCTHLIIPGGETTAFLKLLEFNDLTEPICRHAESGKPILATCAGLIIIAAEVLSPKQKSLELLDCTVERNAYGRQLNSFEIDLEIPIIGDEPFHGIFIRAPQIVSIRQKVEELASYDGHPVLVRQGNIFAATFHPELSGDSRLHSLFLSAG